MAYRYLNSARINSTIKKHGLQLAYTKGQNYFYFLDLTTGDQVGESVMVAKMWHLTIQQWREAAEAAAATRETGVSAEVKELLASLEISTNSAEETVEEELTEA